MNDCKNATDVLVLTNDITFEVGSAEKTARR